MLRRAVINHIMDNVSTLSGRVYQAFLAPSNTRKPYATVKVGPVQGSPGLNYGGTLSIEVRIYNDQDSFLSLDAYEKGIVAALHGREITDNNGGSRYFLQWLSSPGDFVDEEKKLIGRLVVFGAAVLLEPGGDGM